MEIEKLQGEVNSLQDKIDALTVGKKVLLVPLALVYLASIIGILEQLQMRLQEILVFQLMVMLI